MVENKLTLTYYHSREADARQEWSANGTNSKGPADNSCKSFESSGAGDKTRTYDLMITNQLLYQLSYTGIAFKRTKILAKIQLTVQTGSVCFAL